MSASSVPPTREGPSLSPANRAARAAARGYWGLMAAGEPFRLLFPLGAAIGIFGVMMWPLFVWNVTSGYPGVAHARIMIEGFLACFVVGFLGTALPRLLGVPRVTLLESLLNAAALLLAVVLHASGLTLWGDVVFFCVMGTLVFTLLVRALFRNDTPPPAFVLVALGMVCALAGSFSQIIAVVAPSILPGWLPPLGKLMLNQGFLLLPIMGIGAFLLPRFFGLPNRQSLPESLGLPPGWIPKAAFAAACGAAVLGSFVLEVQGFQQAGYALRALAVLVYFFCEVPVHQAGWGGGSLALGLRISLFSIPLGYLLLAAMPERTFAFLHVVFITGFSLLTFTVASRVVLGHSGQTEKFRAPLRSVLVLSALVALAMLTRVTADWLPRVTMSHYAYAAIAWSLGVIIWAAAILPGVRVIDTSSQES